MEWRVEPGLLEYDKQMATLQRQVEEKAQALTNKELTGQHREERLRDLEHAFEELTEKQRLGHLISRVGDAGQHLLLTSDEFRRQFVNGAPRHAYVMSIDIRRSTELMLKALDAQLFAAFITGLADRLRQIVLDNFGIFDRFTGDGILASFPDFYSGPDAGYFAVKAASECHEIFAEWYFAHRGTFACVLRNTGLGIGIDCGSVNMVQVGGDFTVVGKPVVYACRMSDADAGTTLLNQAAYTRLSQDFVSYLSFIESSLEMKHEGPAVAYLVRMTEKSYTPRQPDWTEAPQQLSLKRS